MLPDVALPARCELLPGGAVLGRQMLCRPISTKDVCSRSGLVEVCVRTEYLDRILGV